MKKLVIALRLSSVVVGEDEEEGHTVCPLRHVGRGDDREDHGEGKGGVKRQGNTREEMKEGQQERRADIRGVEIY